MITTDDELSAAEEWIKYWRSTQSAAQSWIGNEQANRHIAKLKAEVDQYRRGVRSET